MTHGERKAPGRSWFFTTALLALTCIFVLCPLAQAQYRTSIQGVVTDAQGAVIQGATLTLTNPATNEKIVRTSNAAGVYNFNALPSTSIFNLEVVAKGFQKKVIDHLDLTPEQANALDLQLAVGSETQTVTVDASVEPLLTTANANTVGVISENQVQSMPSFGRDVFKLIQLTPGLFSDGSQGSGGNGFNLPGTQSGGGATGGNAGIFQTENGPAGQSVGQQFENNGISIDGVNTTSAVWGGNTIITPSEDSVASVTTLTNTYDAEYGRFSGAHVEVTSKSGTNNLHGSFFFTRHSAGLNAYQQDNGQGASKFRDNNQFNQLGGSVGGPIWKNKIFAFFALETLQQGYSPNQSLNWMDTSDFDALAPSGSIASKYLTFAGNAPKGNINAAGSTCALANLTEGVNCVTIAGKGINIGSPLTTGLGKQDYTFIAGTTPGVGSGLSNVADVAQYTTVNPTTSSKYQYNGRLDANPTSKDAVGFMIYWVPQDQTSFNGPRSYDIFHHHQINEAYTAVWNHTFSPNFLNELRGNVSGWHWNEISDNHQSPVGLPTDYIDTTSNFSLASFGPNIGSYLKQWTYGFRDVATKIQSRHTVKFGVDYTKLYYLSACYGCGEPSYNFYNIWDFLNDAPHNEGGSFDPATGLPSIIRQDDLTNLWGVFVQDDWKVRKNLTINAGLRWNYFGPVYEKHNRGFVAVPGPGSAFLSGMQIRKGRDSWSADKGNFGPQVGFSWSPVMFHDKMVVRGGYGLNYNQDELAITQNTQSNNGFNIWPDFHSDDVNHINPNIYYAVSSDAHNLTGYPANTKVITTYGSNGLPTTGSVGVFLMQPDPPTMRTHHYSLDVQYDLGHQIVASLGYQGSVTHNSYFHMNPVGYAASKGWAQNPNIGYGDYWTHMGRGNYNAMLAEVKHQFSHTFMADMQYTWAKSMDTSSAPYSEQYYPNQRDWSYGRSDYNVGQAFKLFGLWQPVLFKGNNGYLEKIAGGWSLSGIFNFHTGFPWNPVYNLPSSLYNSGGGYYQALPSAYLGGAHNDTSNHAYKYGTNFPNGGTAYFAAPVIDSSGFPSKPGVARNSWTLPGYRDVDMTLTKSFGLPKAPILGEAAKLEFRADIYNLFNSVNYNPTSIVNDVRSSRFGQETSALGSRVVTLGARFNF